MTVLKGEKPAIDCPMTNLSRLLNELTNSQKNKSTSKSERVWCERVLIWLGRHWLRLLLGSVFRKN